METSGIALIRDAPMDPLELFREWFAEATTSKDVLQPEALCLATCSRTGQVSARHVLLRRLDCDGFVIVTDRRSKKAEEILSTPHGAMSFLWTYFKDGSRIQRQVRIEGNIHEMSAEEYEDIYEREPLFCKLRSHVCPQGTPVTWEELKEHHDKLYSEFQDGTNALKMPNHFVGFKLFPTMYDYYNSHDRNIADRMCYLKPEDKDEWQHFRIAA